MNEYNPYERPATALSPLSDLPDLAGRWQRLGASIIDSLLISAITFPLIYFAGYWETVLAAAMQGAKPPYLQTLLWSGIGFVIFLLVQGIPLNATGQTWGKRLLKIRIADLTGGKPSLGNLTVKRYLPQQLAALIPFVGNLLVLIDILFIFRADKRCVHDLIAGTRVVNA